MKNGNSAWGCFKALTGVMAAVFVAGSWSACGVLAKRKTISTATPYSYHDEYVPAAPIAAEAPAPSPKTPAQIPTPAPDPVPAAKSAAQPTPDQSTPLHKFWGVVQSFDAGAGALVVKSLNGSTREFNVGAAAKITKGGDFEAIALSDIKEGDHITLGYRGTAVESVHVKVAPTQ